MGSAEIIETKEETTQEISLNQKSFAPDGIQDFVAKIKSVEDGILTLEIDVSNPIDMELKIFTTESEIDINTFIINNTPKKF